MVLHPRIAVRYARGTARKASERAPPQLPPACLVSSFEVSLFSVWGTAHRNSTSGAILSFSGHMTFSRGRFANFSCSFESNAFQQMEIFGTEGNVMVPNFVVPSNPRYVWQTC
jgi:hypothetical protein